MRNLLYLIKRGIFYHPSVGNGIYQGFLSLDFYKILQGEWWRFFTFVVYPPGLTTLWSVLAIAFAYIAGRNIEDLIGWQKILLYYGMAVLVQIAVAAAFFFLKEQVIWMDLSFWGWTLFPLLAWIQSDRKVYLLTPFPIPVKLPAILTGLLFLVRIILERTTSKISLMGQLAALLLFLPISKSGKNT